MVLGDWGATVGEVKIGGFWDGYEFRNNGSEARLIGGRISINSPTISDSTNHWEWSGGAVSNGTQDNISVSGSGARVVRQVAGEWQALSWTVTTRVWFDGLVTGINHGGGATRTFHVPVDLPRRRTIPTAVSAGRISDTQHRVSWSTVVESGGEAVAGHVVERQQGSDAATPVQVASLGASAQSWVDGSTTANSRYRWRIKAVVSSDTVTSGQASQAPPSAWSPWVVTTPSAPTSVAVVKAGTTCTTSWVNSAPHRSGTSIEHSADNGVSWQAATSVAAAVTSYADTGLAITTHRYRLRHTAAGVPLAAGGTTTLYSGWVWSANVDLSRAPNPPLVTTPAVMDAALSDLVISVVHQPLDTTVQTAAEVRWRVVGGPVWTTQTLTTQTSWRISAGSLPNGYTWEIQARTKGENASFGSWSSSKLTRTSGTPSVTITSPGATVTDGLLTVTWTFFDPDGSSQAAATISLWDSNGVRVEVGTVGSATTWTAATPLTNRENYSVRVQGVDADGLQSHTASTSFSVEFLPPPLPVLTAVFDPDTGQVEIGVELPTPVSGVEVPPDTVTVERWTTDRWVTIASDIPTTVGDGGELDPHPTEPGLFSAAGLAGGAGLFEPSDEMTESGYTGLWRITSDTSVTVTDPIPPLSIDVLYRVTAWATSGASAGTTITVATAGSCWIFLNAGAGWGVAAKLKVSAQVGYAADRPKVLQAFYGGVTREYPGERTAYQWQVSGDVATWPADEPRIGPREPWAAIAAMPAPVCIRTPLGHRGFGSISAVPQSSQAGSPHTGVSATVTETTYHG